MLDKKGLRRRLYAKTVRTANGCWIWQGAGAGSLRYSTGICQVASKRWTVRRLAYLIWGRRPPLQEYHVLRATCCNPACINPDHLYPTTRYKGGRPKVKHQRKEG